MPSCFLLFNRKVKLPGTDYAERHQISVASSIWVLDFGIMVHAMIAIDSRFKTPYKREQWW